MSLLTNFYRKVSEEQIYDPKELCSVLGTIVDEHPAKSQVDGIRFTGRGFWVKLHKGDIPAIVRCTTGMVSNDKGQMVNRCVLVAVIQANPVIQGEISQKMMEFGMEPY